MNRQKWVKNVELKENSHVQNKNSQMYTFFFMEKLPIDKSSKLMILLFYTIGIFAWLPKKQLKNCLA